MAASAASSRAASTLRFRTRRSSSSSGSAAPRTASIGPSSSSRATVAQLCRETTCERIFASRPSEKSGYRSYSACATASSRTLSPRNSRRSYADARSAAQEAWVNTCSSRPGGRASISLRRACGPRARPVLLVRRDVVDGLPHGRDLLRVLVGDLDSELILELHDQLHEVERVRVEVFLEGSLFGDYVLVDAQLLDEHFLHPFEDFLSRRCHVTSLAGKGRERAGSYTGHA